MKNTYYLISCIFIFCCACSDYYPKPYGYYRIELQDPVYKSFVDTAGQFSFNIQEMTTIEPVIDTVKAEWFNIVYPSLDARIYCSYVPIIDKNDLAERCEESRKFVYKHVLKADEITEETYSDPDNRVYSIIYDIEGNVATPVQFVITDSTNYFFRGALYFDIATNPDSIAPVVTYIRNDIRELIQHFHWEKK